MCGKAVAEAGVPHVVAVKSGNDVSGTTSTLHHPALPVILVGGPETIVALSTCVPCDHCRISMGMNASHIALLKCIRHSNVPRLSFSPKLCDQTKQPKNSVSPSMRR